MSQIIEIVGKAKSYDDAVNRVMSAFPEVQLTRITEMLAASLFTANAIGRKK